MIREFLLLEEIKKSVNKWKDDINKMYTLSSIYELEAALYKKDSEEFFKEIHEPVFENKDVTIG